MAKKSDALQASALPDWRIHLAASIAEVKQAGTVLPRAKPGDIVVLFTETETEEEGRVGFITPGAATLPLSVAIKAALRADGLRGTLTFGGPHRTIPNQDRPVLYDFFEESMTAALFGFQALESWANQAISSALRDSTFPFKRRKGTQTLSAVELERQASTEEKLGDILPKLAGISSPKGTSVWEDFRNLKDVRDSTTHLKSEEHYVRGGIDTGSLYYRLLAKPAVSYPQWAIRMLRHFQVGPHPALDEAESRLGDGGQKASQP